MLSNNSSSFGKAARLLSLFQIYFRPQVSLIVTAMTFVATGMSPAVGQLVHPSDTQSQLILDSHTNWKIGSQLDRFTLATISASWTEAELRNRLISFANTQKAAIFVDRRIDPSQPINLTLNHVSPEQFLWAVAAKQGIGVCRIGDFYYFGPPETAASLPTVWKKMRSESSKQKRSYEIDWTQRQALKTTQVVNIKQLIEELAAANQFQISNPEKIPHDIWAEFELPKMSLDGRLAILLVGFDQFFSRSSDGKTIEIVDFEPVKRALYETAKIDTPRDVAKELKPKFPNLKITATKTRLSVSGPPLEVANLRATLIGRQSVQKVDLQDIAYEKVTARASRLAFLQKVAKQVGRQLIFDSELKPRLDEQINLELKKVSVFELLEATLEGSRLQYEISDTEIRISER